MNTFKITPVFSSVNLTAGVEYNANNNTEDNYTYLVEVNGEIIVMMKNYFRLVGSVPERNVPVKFQVSYNNDTEYKDFTDAMEAHRFTMEHGDSSVVTLNNSGDAIELINGHYHIVDTEPADDGYDYDKYY
jgi:hypothetical protein